METIPITIASRKIKLPEGKLTKDVNDLYKEKRYGGRLQKVE
jgi:hypothetical protein